MNEIIAEIKNVKSGKKELRNFGILFAFIFLGVGIFAYYKHSVITLWFMFSAFLFFISFVYPKILLPFQKLWMIFALILGWFTSRIILFALFYLVFTPLHFFIRKDLLDEKIERNRKSYWIKRETTGYDKKETERQF